MQNGLKVINHWLWPGGLRCAMALSKILAYLFLLFWVFNLLMSVSPLVNLGLG